MWLLIAYVAIFLLAEFLRPKPNLEDAKPAGLGDFDFPTATEGRSVPLYWGTVQIKGPNVVWYGDYGKLAIKENIKTGLFTSSSVITGFRYFLGVQFALSRGIADSLLRIWIGEKLVFDGELEHEDTFFIDEPKLFGGDSFGSGGIKGTVKFFTGTKDQDPSVYLSQFQSEGGDTPAYRGTSYLEFQGGYLGNSTSVAPWAFEVRRIPTGPATGSNESINDGNDANPVNVLYEILTNNDWGLGYDPSVIDTVSFSAAGSTLKDEGNGFSFLLDHAIPAIDLIRIVEEQIDGVLFENAVTGKWEINLARGGYDIDDLREATGTKVLAVKNFSRGAWEDTTNQIRAEFFDRSDEYKLTYAFAQDSANVRIQAGVNISDIQKWPGVKDKTLANSLAWRSLRTLSYPLARATLILDRTFYDIEPGEVIAFTSVSLSLTKLPMRVLKISYGTLQNNQITVDVVQDIFAYKAGSFGDPIPTNWEQPVDVLTAFDTDKQIAIEAPRALVIRDPNGDNLITDKIWCAARQKGPETAFQIVERHAVGTPSGAYAFAGQVFGFLYIGQLNSSLAMGTAIPTTTIVLSSTPDSQTNIEGSFLDNPSLADIGLNLLNLVMVDNEFMLVTSAQTSGANVQLNGVYRGALDSVQAAHSSGAKVFLLFVGGGITSSVFTPGDTVDIKLLPESSTDLLVDTAATAIQITMSDRVRRPYAPSNIELGGTLWASTISLEQTGSDGETFGFVVDLNRRDYRTLDEVASLLSDAAALFADFPAANTTTQELDLRNDPAGVNTLLFTTTGSGQTYTLLRIDILKATNGVLPTTLRLAARSKHFELGVQYTSRVDLVFDFAATSGLTGQFNFGALAQNVDSNDYTATVNGTYNFTLSSAFSSGSVEYRINAGAWTPLILATNTTGSILGVLATDVIEIRHTSAVGGAKKFITMDAPGAGQDGYAVLYV